MSQPRQARTESPDGGLQAGGVHADDPPMRKGGAHAEGRGPRSRVLTVATQVVIAGTMAVTFAAVARAPATPARAALALEAIHLARTLEVRLDEELRRLSVVSAFATAEAEPEWRSFSRMLADVGAPGAGEVVAWAPRVTQEARDLYEATNGREAYRSFQITEPDPMGGTRLADPRPDHFPMHFLDPQPDSGDLLGLDLAARPNVRAAVAQAEATGEPTLVGPLRLSPEDPVARRLLLILPVYKTARVPGWSSSSTRPPRFLRGVAVAALRWDALLVRAGVPRPVGDSELGVRLAPAWGRPETARPTGQDPDMGALSAEAPLRIEGQPWTLELTLPGRAAVWAQLRR